ncbi:MAG: AAA family ATPase [Candidatus Paceibacterota bacterium]
MTKIYGHESKKKLFIDLINRNQLGHAYLFHGDSQVGKFLFSLHLANFLEEGKFEKPSKTLIDSVFITEDEKGKIGIDSFRDLRSFLFQKPLKSKKRLIVVDNADKMTPHAQSSILKIVEESPSHITFVFITHNPETILAPLRSRMIKIYFGRLSDLDIKKYASVELNKELSLEEIKLTFGRVGRLIDTGKMNNKDFSLDKYLEDKILNLYFKDKVKNYQKLSQLLKKESELKRFNLNQKLQEKVIKAIR